MVDKMLRIAGRGDDGTAKAIKTDDDGRLYTKSQNVVEEKKFANEVELRDTGLYITSRLTLTNYTKVTYVVDNTLDADVRVRPRTYSMFLYYFESGEFKSTNSDVLIVPKNRNNIIINEVIPQVFNATLPDLSFSINALTVPTEGSITIKMFGLRN